MYKESTGLVCQSIIFLSDDTSHDYQYHAVHHFVTMSLDHLDTAGVDCRRVFMWSGGSAAQYKWTSRKFCRSFYVCRSWQHRTKLLRFRTWKRRGRWRGWLRQQGDGEDTSGQMVIINVVSDWY